MSELVSIIIPTYNRAHLLGETLDSVIDLNYPDWECLVVDDGSTDHTPELMEFYGEKDQRFRYFKRPSGRDKGANACRNYGFEKSKGNYVNFFDSDDLFHPEKLTIQLQKLRSSDSDFCVSRVNFFKDKKENILQEWKGEIFSKDPLSDYIRGEIAWLTPSILWKSNFLKKFDYLFDEDLQASQEWEFHIRILSNEPGYVLEDLALAFIRKHDENVTYGEGFAERDWNYYQARLKVYQNQDIPKKQQSVFFLRRYLLDRYKEMVRRKDKKAFKAYRKFIVPEKKLRNSAKLNALLAIVIFKFLRKGDTLLNKVKLTK
ncbi:MAG: glycosyltransferase family 2 protein [Christiangramia sp.]|uniref:glycosyltransferase family 2 protein n=1 Tax=Christiangramia sp. TaxID=1931228 RepID=UPI003242E5BE